MSVPPSATAVPVTLVERVAATVIAHPGVSVVCGGASMNIPVADVAVLVVLAPDLAAEEPAR